MSEQTRIFVDVCKEIIDRGNLEELQLEVAERWRCEGAEQIAWEYVILKTYLHACLRKKKDIAEWVAEQMDRLDPIQKMAIRQMLPYGRWLMGR